jgi:hypothetical protein
MLTKENRYVAPIKSKIGEPYLVNGNKKKGVRIAIPISAWLDAMQPRAYTCAAMQDGTLVYQPVRS